MKTIRATVTIDAPIDDVFAYMARPEIHPDVSPGLVDVSSVRELPGGGYETDFTYRMLGREFDGHSVDVEVDPPTRRVYEYEGDVDGRITYEFAADDGRTRFTYTHEFEPLGPKVAGRLTGPVMRRYLRRDAKAMLRNVKRNVEAETAPMAA